MMDELLTKANKQTAIVEFDANRVDEHPAAVYLAGLSVSSRRTMLGALDIVAQIVTGNETMTASEIPWHRLRFQHTQAVRSVLSER